MRTPPSAVACTLHSSQSPPLLDSGKALILLAGESEENLRAALAGTRADVEVMLVHNLWGPRAATMRDKNAIVVRTAKSGILCSEFESFLYKHGAGIFHDTPRRHDFLMGIGQRLPTIISIALGEVTQPNVIRGVVRLAVHRQILRDRKSVV